MSPYNVDEEWPRTRFNLPNGTILEANLARTHYAPGDTVVGSLRLGSQPYPTSLQVFASGMCKLDKRWHKASDIDTEKQAGMPFLPPDTIPFWKTDVIECMSLPEREDGAYAPPTPIIIPGMEDAVERVTKEMRYPELPPHKAFTFRFELPSEGPPTLVARSCRYYYLVTLMVQCETEELFLLPIPVRRIDRSQRRRTFKQIGFQVIAHSNGFPTTLSVSEWNQLDEEWEPSPPARFSNVQTLPINDPNTNQFLSTLTIPTGRDLFPGSPVILQFSQINTDEQAPVRLVQVSACAQGLETVRPSTAVAQRHLWDAESFCVDGLSLCSITLQLPDTIPYTVSTEFVEITATIVADLTTFTVESETFGNIHLEIPCQVIHPAEYDSDADEDQEDEGITAFKESLGIETSDIEKELKILTLAMGEACGIRPKP